jgi:short-subunit dehydrogenase
MARRTLDGATVVITGASSGIGQATAEAFAREGARLVLAARGVEALERVAESCRTLGGEALVVPTDVTDADAVAALAGAARGFGGTIDVWVSNVGVGAVGAFHETPIEAHQQTIRANLIGHMNDAHAVLPIFMEQGHGVFINMISLGGFAAAPFASAYSASKFGLRGFSEALRAELKGWPDIHICDVFPAFIDTPGISHAANYTGRRLTAPPPVHDARRVATAIVRLAKYPRRSKMVGPVALAARIGHFLAPTLSTKLAAFGMEAYLRRAPAVPVTDGNLYEPPAEPGGIDGGLRSPNRPQIFTVSAGAMFAAGFALATLIGRRRGRS